MIHTDCNISDTVTMRLITVHKEKPQLHYISDIITDHNAMLCSLPAHQNVNKFHGHRQQHYCVGPRMLSEGGGQTQLLQKQVSLIKSMIF